MPWRAGLHLAGHPVESFGQECTQRPSGAVAGEHVQVVDVDASVAMGFPHLGRIDMVEPVVGNHLSGHVQDQPAQGITLVGVGVNAPVGLLQVFVHRRGHIHQGLSIPSQLVVLLAVDNVGSGGLEVVGRNEDLFHHILDIFYMRRGLAELVAQDLQHLSGQESRLVSVELSRGLTGPPDGGSDLGGLEGNRDAVTLHHSPQGKYPGLFNQCRIIHDLFPPSFYFNR